MGRRCGIRREHGSAGPILLLIGAILVFRSNVVGGSLLAGSIMLVIGLSKVLRAWGGHRWSGVHRIEVDARSHGVRIPRDARIRADLEGIYAACAGRAQAASVLASDLEEVLQSMWLELRYAGTYGQWRKVLHQVRQGLSEAGPDGSPVTDSLGRLMRASVQWREAQREARGAT